MLNTYMKQVQRLLRDQSQNLWNPEDLVEYINRGRRLIAEKAQCIRFMPPSWGSVSTISVTNGGTSYTASPTVTISGPDTFPGTRDYPQGRQAEALATVVGGVIIDIQVTEGGLGYFRPTVTITDNNGSDATATAATDALNNLAQFQEVYQYADVPLANFPGIGAILTVISVSVIFSGQRFTPRYLPFSDYQALVRQFTGQYSFVPTVWSQFGQGSTGSLYFYPLPSQPYQCEWDCLGLPIDLTQDTDFEAIPQPWQDAVPLYACHQAFLEIQNFNAAMGYLTMFDNFVSRYSQGARPYRTLNPYGRAY